MSGCYDVIKSKLLARQIGESETETIVSFVQMIEEGVRQIDDKKLSSEPLLVFIPSFRDLISGDSP